jgi:hypothetical protein
MWMDSCGVLGPMRTDRHAARVADLDHASKRGIRMLKTSATWGSSLRERSNSKATAENAKNLLALAVFRRKGKQAPGI